MKHVIIGTAGHVDHGKTTLIKALTGIDTDRLEEEKRRGLTIEPGFAYLDFDDGTRAGIIDVPGHERFTRNMLAGAGGIDLSMLVIAADEGIMPQTREHLGILGQLGICDGFVALTKIDKAEPDWIDLVEDDIAQFTSGTYLEGKPILRVSAQTGEGIQKLRETLREMIDKVSGKNINVPFRLPVDRVFPVDGFGTVVTGTLIEGSVNVGDTAQILPLREKAIVRNIQVHGENVSTGYAGQRTAISLGGVKRGKIKRGDVIAADTIINIVTALDVKLNILPDAKRTVKNGDKLHFYHGARTLLCKAILLDKQELLPGDGCFARLKLTEPLPCKRGDRFVVRFYSPLETIGGGVILNTIPNRRVSRAKAEFDALKVFEQGSNEEVAAIVANKLSGVFTSSYIMQCADIDDHTCGEVIMTLEKENEILRLQRGKYISEKHLKKLSEKCKELLTEYHASNPLRVGMGIAELRQKLMPEADTIDSSDVLQILDDRNVIKLSEKFASIPEYSPALSPSQAAIKDKLLAKLKTTGYDVPTPIELSEMFQKKEKQEFEQVFESMKSSGELVMLSPQIFWTKDTYGKATDLLRGHFERKETLSLAECRDLLGTSRKYALALLEHLDGKQVTKMVNTERVLINKL